MWEEASASSPSHCSGTIWETAAPGRSAPPVGGQDTGAYDPTSPSQGPTCLSVGPPGPCPSRLSHHCGAWPGVFSSASAPPGPWCPSPSIESAGPQTTAGVAPSLRRTVRPRLQSYFLSAMFLLLSVECAAFVRFVLEAPDGCWCSYTIGTILKFLLSSRCSNREIQSICVGTCSSLTKLIPF